MSDEAICRRVAELRAQRMLPCECMAPGHAVMVEIWGVYDGGLFYQCELCKHMWHRWTEGRLHDLAEKYMNKWAVMRSADAQSVSEAGEGGTATAAPDVPELG